MPTLFERFRVAPGERVQLDRHDPADKAGLDRAAAKAMMQEGAERLEALQERLYAHRRWAVLVVLQGMDASGKDGVVRTVTAGMNPRLLRIAGFEAPNAAELRHDYLWRVHQLVPPRGSIGFFNRSHYEDVLVPRVNPAVLDKQMLPPSLVDEGLWDRRLDDIAWFERYLGHQGTVILKVFLHISPDEQRKRLLARIEDPAKQWKVDPSDFDVRDQWAQYQAAYEGAIGATSTARAPWFIVPADHKWFARLAVQRILLDALEGLDLDLPRPGPDRAAMLEAARKRLTG